MFFECNTENTLILAKFQPFLAEVRTQVPDFLVRTEQLVAKYAIARANVDRYAKMVATRTGVEAATLVG
jgi:hypothetical protein